MSFQHIEENYKALTADNGGNISKQLFLWAFSGILNDTEMIDLSPPSSVHHLPVLAIAGVYTTLFLIGFCGNVSMLTILVHLIYQSRKLPSGGGSKGGSVENTFLYIIALSLMDLMVLLSLPFTVSDMLLGHWIFGTFVCKIHWTIESTGKIMSTFTLLLMSFDRFMGVCYPMQTKLRDFRFSSFSLFALIGVALLLLSPLTYFAEARVMNVQVPNVQYTFGVWARFVTVKCRLNNDMNKNIYMMFTYYIFALGFVLPILLLGFFYSQMLRKLQKHCKASHVTSNIPMRRIVLHTLAICAFYFCCWCPYWAGVLWAYNIDPTSSNSIQKEQEPSKPVAAEENQNSGYTDSSANEYVYSMYFIHALPIINSSLNWIFYAQLNTQLKRKREEIARVLENKSVASVTAIGNNHSSSIGGSRSHIVSAAYRNRHKKSTNNSSMSAKHSIVSFSARSTSAGPGGAKSSASVPSFSVTKKFSIINRIAATLQQNGGHIRRRESSRSIWDDHFEEKDGTESVGGDSATAMVITAPKYAAIRGVCGGDADSSSQQPPARTSTTAKGISNNDNNIVMNGQQQQHFVCRQLNNLYREDDEPKDRMTAQESGDNIEGGDNLFVFECGPSSSNVRNRKVAIAAVSSSSSSSNSFITNSPSPKNRRQSPTTDVETQLFLTTTTKTTTSTPNNEEKLPQPQPAVERFILYPKIHDFSAYQQHNRQQQPQQQQQQQQRQGPQVIRRSLSHTENVMMDTNNHSSSFPCDDDDKAARGDVNNHLRRSSASLSSVVINNKYSAAAAAAAVPVTGCGGDQQQERQRHQNEQQQQKHLGDINDDDADEYL